MPLPITDDNFADMESIKVKVSLILCIWTYANTHIYYTHPWTNTHILYIICIAHTHTCTHTFTHHTESYYLLSCIQDVLTEEERSNFKPTPALLKKGEASFHHPLTVHGSYANK